MHQYRHFFAVDVNSGMLMARMPRPVMTGDMEADRIVVTLTDGPTVVDLTGMTASARVIRADGHTVRIPGTVDGETASVTLTDECYAVDGPIVITVALAEGVSRLSVLRIEMEAIA